MRRDWPGQADTTVLDGGLDREGNMVFPDSKKYAGLGPALCQPERVCDAQPRGMLSLDPASRTRWLVIRGAAHDSFPPFAQKKRRQRMPWKSWWREIKRKRMRSLSADLADVKMKISSASGSAALVSIRCGCDVMMGEPVVSLNAERNWRQRAQHQVAGAFPARSAVDEVVEPGFCTA